ncbi:hypothetical protein BN1058_01536 [Paraliobacillus sp. PM-2]|uniref:YesL family protein n=1 Tax=Paraliobacillus sp. PM-2 TaxID=1462524 RepID=UPI00061CAE2A|nr:YesL family protein [Paraliobacillus sp. PM-2]CQR47229.1 hypothetical protein BN1058_01536 [Paraliobacillus sp. PM-2]
MEDKRLYTFISNIGNWIVSLAYINLLWVAYSTMGLFILGMFPATVSLFSVIRQWLKHKHITSVWNVYHSTFKKEFVKSNIIGYFYLTVGVITYVDFKFFHTQDNIMFLTLSYTVLIILFIYGITGLFLFPVLVHYDLKIMSYFKYTFLIIVSHPVIFLITVLVLMSACLLMLFIPGLILFFGLSVPAYIIMWSSYKAFKKVDVQSSVK